MQSFLKQCIDSEPKRTHWAFQLAYTNLCIVASYMVLVDHVKSDLTCLDEMSLLTPDLNKFMLCTSFPQHEGGFLFFYLNLGAFVRSGKVVWCGFIVRHKEHVKKSKDKKAHTNFFPVSITGY